MSKRKSKSPADYIVPLNINGLEGRMLRTPAPAKHDREILFIYGHHAMLERWWSLIENLNAYGAVTMPDLPGFGGMDSFHKIRKRPTIDAYADYLAAFLKLRFRRKRVTIVAVSFGFVIVTRMLQRYPELSNKVDLLVSMAGFMHKDDFIYSSSNMKLFRKLTRLLATRPVAIFIRYAGLNKFVLRSFYTRLPNSKRRMIEVTPEELDANMEFEVKIWQANDVRTHWLTTNEFLKLDNCAKRIDLSVIHITTKEEQYFNNNIVKQHMLVVFSGYRNFVANSKAHTPSIMADKKAMGVMLPPGLRRILAKP